MRYTNVALAIALAAAVNVAGAQTGTRPVSLGVSGGLSFPTGDALEGLDAGFTVGGHVGVQSQTMPLGVRFDALYNRWEAGDDEVVDGHLRVLGGTANVMLRVPTATSIRPYLLAGAGVYSTRATVDTPGAGSVSGDSQTNLGLQAGAGLDFPLSGITPFLELRFHSVFTDEENTNFVPLVFGIRF